MRTLKRVFLAALVLAIASMSAVLLAPLYHETPPTESPNVVNDVARLNRTVVREVIQPTTENEIRDAVLKAAPSGTKVTIAGKRHSMGGQTLYPDSVSIDILRFNKIIALDERNKILTVQSGATWNDIQQFLNPHGLAVLVMQGPNVFTVGGSISVNAHGWDMRHGPVGASVEWFRILLADGSIRRCSRQENSELFHFVIGGYGLFGVILDVGLRVTDNSAYTATMSELDYSQLPAFFANEIHSSPKTDLGEADLSIASGTLLRDAIAITYNRDDADPRRTDPLQNDQHIFRDRYFFDLSREYDWGKSVRWIFQKRLEYPHSGDERTRNNIFRAPIERIRHYSASDTDILQEYFIPPRSFVPFIDGLREIIKNQRVNLLNATVRFVESNDDAFLSYSGQGSLTVVLYVNVKTSARGRADSATTTKQIIDLALKNNGAFYLPYVLDYDKPQLIGAYPMANDFFAAKKRYDPAELFFSEFYSKYSH
jgi:decaprenylphospho-beta-D-ribofuranose 2-oxidase